MLNKPTIEPLRLGRPRKAKATEKPLPKSTSLEEDLYFIMTCEAQEKFYINDAEKPAWLILGKYCILTKTKSKYELWFATIHRWQFYTLRECHEKIEEMVSKAKVPMKVWRETRAGKRTLFATKE